MRSIPSNLTSAVVYYQVIPGDGDIFRVMGHAIGHTHFFKDKLYGEEDWKWDITFEACSASEGMMFLEKVAKRLWILVAQRPTDASCFATWGRANGFPHWLPASPRPRREASQGLDFMAGCLK